MGETSVFATVCEEVEARTDLDKLASRGTVRLALKEAGLAPDAVSPSEMEVVLARVLPSDLGKRGVADADDVCRAIAARVATLSPETLAQDSPEAVFTRLGGAS